MKAVLCLGNPGEKYRLNRHNAGFMVADCLAGKLGKKWQAGANMLYFTYDDAVIIKPQTYMNGSGEVFPCLAEPVACGDVLVVVDEVNLPLGRLRFRARGSAGGHNGLRSIEQTLGSPDYCRLRIGIGSGGAVAGGDLIDFVLGDFSGDELELLGRVVELSAGGVLEWLESGIGAAQGKYNGIDLGDAGVSDSSDSVLEN